MARPSKSRRVCQLPIVDEFMPQGCAPACEAVVMAVDEYATIYLIDYKGMTQQECAEQMQVARTTVQGMYAHARRKVALCLAEGRRLRIEGGDYTVCSGNHAGCCRRTDDVCQKREMCTRRQNEQACSR